MFERSEFGRRAASGEERRGPGGRSPSGSCPAKAVLLTFVATKVSRASARKLLILILPLISLAVWKHQGQERRSRAVSHAAAREFLFDGPKRNQKVLSPDASRHGCAAPVPCASRTTGHAAQTRCAQTWAALRPRRPAMLGSLYGSKIKIQITGNSNSNSNGNGNGNRESAAT